MTTTSPIKELVEENINFQGPFYDNLSRSSKEIIKKRAENTAIDVKDEYDNVLKELFKMRRNLNSEIRNHQDLSPTSKDALSFEDGFKASEWVKRDTEMHFKLDEVERKISIVTRRIQALYV
jgi:hypothetical protein